MFTTDNGGKIREAERYYEHEGIVLNPTVRYQRQRNVIVKGLHGTLVSAARAALYHTNLAAPFWEDAVVQYRALQGGWKEKKLSGNYKLSGLGDTRVNNCTVLIFNYLILFS